GVEGQGGRIVGTGVDDRMEAVVDGIHAQAVVGGIAVVKAVGEDLVYHGGLHPGGDGEPLLEEGNVEVAEGLRSVRLSLAAAAVRNLRRTELPISTGPVGER